MLLGQWFRLVKSLVLVISLIGLTAAWLSIHQIAVRKFRRLHTQLPAAYQSAIAAPPSEEAGAHLIALSVDLSRKEFSNIPFDALTDTERDVAHFALAIDQLPKWVVNIAKKRLKGPELTVVNQLQEIKTSRPNHAKKHFGAVQTQLRQRAQAKV